MTNGISNNGYAKVAVVLLIAAFFGPYFPGTPLRLDQLVGWTYLIALAYTLFARGSVRLGSRQEKRLAIMAYAILCWMAIRLFMDVGIYRNAFQAANQFSYFCAGIAIFALNRDRLLGMRHLVIETLLFMSILVNLFALLQFANPNHELVSTGLQLYGGREYEEHEYGDFSTLAAKTLLGGGQAVSIFSGVHGLAIFDLFTIATAYGAMKDPSRRGPERYLAIAALLLALFGGVLTGSKTLIFGLFLFFGMLALAGMRSLRQMTYALIGLAVFAAMFYVFSSELRVTGDVLALILDGRLWEVFSSRFGAFDRTGYLEDVIAKTFEPFTLAFGLGSHAFEYKYSDFQFRQVLLIGGIPFFLLFYGFLAYLLILNWKAAKTSSYGFPLFALGLVFLISGLGQDVHLQARTMPLWIIVNLLVGLDRSKASAAALAQPARESIRPTHDRQGVVAT